MCNSSAETNGPAHILQGCELQIWTVSDGNGFQVLRFTKPIRELLANDMVKDDKDDDNDV